MQRKFYYSLIFTLFLFSANLSLAGYAVKSAGNYSNKFLTVIQWDKKYDLDRKTDIDYLLGSVNSPELNGLNDQQKKELVILMQTMTLNQMIKDREYFKNYLLDQYTKFFTIDELQKLINYYQTDLMQMVINAKLDQKKITIEEINDKLLKSSVPDKSIIEWFRNSYLNARYSRFLENINPKLNNMIAQRLKEVLDMVIKKIPEIARYVKDSQSGLDHNLIQESNK